jgi:hypothetical protein
MNCFLTFQISDFARYRTPGTKITHFYDAKWDTLEAFLELQNVDILWVLGDLSKTRVIFPNDSNGPKIESFYDKNSLNVIFGGIKIWNKLNPILDPNRGTPAGALKYIY